jgi:hypothetical protein
VSPSPYCMHPQLFGRLSNNILTRCLSGGGRLVATAETPQALRPRSEQRRLDKRTWRLKHKEYNLRTANDVHQPHFKSAITLIHHGCGCREGGKGRKDKGGVPLAR